jgi:hypothetical protein
VYADPLAKANGKLRKPQVSPNPEVIMFMQNDSLRATYKSRL